MLIGIIFLYELENMLTTSPFAFFYLFIRGTSTHDGVSIAMATIKHFIAEVIM